MEKRTRLEQPAPLPSTLSPSSSGRRSNDSNSPEFEFWMIRNPSFPQPHLLSADELFVDGVLLPLDLLSHNPTTITAPTQPPEPTSEPEPPGPGPQSSVFSSSRRWRDIFRLPDKKPTVATTAGTGNEEKEKEKEKEKETKKKHRKSGSGAGAGAGAELNINIWPFSRSRSAGNGGSRPKMGGGAGASSRKVSSAPCSRSNSAGESKSSSRKSWPSSPGRAGAMGIHIGRSSPVWQVRRSGGGSGFRSGLSEAAARNGVDKAGAKRENLESRESSSSSSCTTKTDAAPVTVSSGAGARTSTPNTTTTTTRVLKNLNVPTCIGYRQQLSCRSDEERLLGGGDSAGDGDLTSGGDGAGAGNGSITGGSKLFNLRTLFSKRVY